MSAVDPTVVVERMARRLRAAGAPHPVAAALAVATRGHARLGRADFAAATGLPLEVVQAAEDGEIAFGDLPVTVSGVGADLLSLADLEREWHGGPRRAASLP